MGGIVVQAGDIGEFLAARMFKTFTDFLVDFLERFNAVGRKRRGTNGDAFLARFGQSGHFLDRIGFQPLLRAKARLERGHDLGLVPSQPLAQQPRGFLALAVVGVAFAQITFGHTMIRTDQHFGLVFHSGIGPLDRLRQGVDIDWLVKIRRHDPRHGLPFFQHQRPEKLVIGRS